LLDRHPIFWVADARYLVVICASALLTVVSARVVPLPGETLLVADALGLALFAMSGAEIAEATGRSPIIVGLMGTMTGVVGGVLRDLVCGVVPLILGRDSYATAAIAGIALYVALQRAGVRRSWAFGVGMVTVVGLRLMAVGRGWELPIFQLQG